MGSNPIWTASMVAQFGRVPACGAGGCGFKSRLWIKENPSWLFNKTYIMTVGQKVKGVTSPSIEDLNDFCEMEVVKVEGDDIYVEVMAHEYYPNIVSERYWVSSADLVGGSYSSATATPSPVAASAINNAILLGVI